MKSEENNDFKKYLPLICIVGIPLAILMCSSEFNLEKRLIQIDNSRLKVTLRQKWKEKNKSGSFVKDAIANEPSITKLESDFIVNKVKSCKKVNLSEDILFEKDLLKKCLKSIIVNANSIKEGIEINVTLGKVNLNPYEIKEEKLTKKQVDLAIGIYKTESMKHALKKAEKTIENNIVSTIKIARLQSQLISEKRSSKKTDMSKNDHRLFQRIEIFSSEKSFNNIIVNIHKITGLKFLYPESLDGYVRNIQEYENDRFDFNYKGDVSGLLDLLSLKLMAKWTFVNKEVKFSPISH